MSDVCQVADSPKIGTHALRRGMARDIIDAGGLSGNSNACRRLEERAAYAQYLRENQVEDKAVADLLIEHSDSE